MSLSSQAQLLNELGVSVGGANYSGDIGDEYYIMPNRLAGGLIYRRNLNSRITLRASYTFYNLAEADSLSTNIVRQRRNYSFTNLVNEGTLGVEFNFLDYDITNPNSNFTPYIFFELAGINYSEIDHYDPQGGSTFKSSFSYAIPLGLGFKSSLTRQFGIALELRARYAMTDQLDYTTETIDALNLGNPRYNDWYFFTGIMITYSFQRPPCAVKPRY